MNVDRIVHLVAGIMVLASIAMAHYVDVNWIFLAGFVGLNLAQSGLTNFCPLASILKRLGVPQGSCCS